MYDFAIRLRVSLTALVLAFAVSACGLNITPEEHLAKAKALVEQGNMRVAGIEVANALEKNPNLVEARLLRSRIALALGDGAGAEKEARKAVELGLNPADVQAILVKSLLMQGEIDSVLNESKTFSGLPTAMDKATILGLRGQAFLLQGKFELAKGVLDEAIQVEPASAEALVGLIALHAFRRDSAGARHWAELGITRQPNSPEVWSAKGDVELAGNDLVKAEEAFSQAIRYRHFQTPDTAKRALIRATLKKYQEAQADIQSLQQAGLGKHPFVSHVAGRIHYMQQQYQPAAEAFEISHGAEPNSLINRLYLAASYHFLGQQEKALQHAQYVQRAAPTSASVRELLGGIHLSRAEYAEAQATLTQALAKSPDNTNLLRLLGSAALMEGDLAKGVEYFNRLVALSPDSSEARDQLMIARLLAGRQLGVSQAEGYETEFLLALEAVRDKQLNRALDLANKLRTRYPDQVDPVNLLAAIYLMAGQADKAKPELEKALKLKPGEPTATRNLAKIEELGGNPKRARQLLQGLVQAQPGDHQAAMQLADVETRLGNHGAVIPLLERTLQSAPHALDVRARLAVEHLRAGRPQKVTELTQGLSEAQLKQQPALLELRGKALMQAGDLNSARGTFDQWKKIQPNSAAAHFYFSETLANAGNLAEARKSLEQAIKLDPRYLPARVGEVKMLVHANRIDAAGKALAKLRQDFGNRAEVLGIEGWFALGTRKYAEAEQSLTSALKLAPNSEVAMLLARALVLQNRTDAAIKLMRDWLKTRPEDLGISMHLAGAYLGLKRDDDARKVYAEIVKRYPNHVPALNNLAWLGRDKDMNESLKYAQHAHAIAPQDPYVKDTLGMLMLQRGELTRAHELVKQAVELAPREPQFQLHLAQVLLKQERQAQARKVLQDLIKLAPDSEQAKQAQGLLAAASRP